MFMHKKKIKEKYKLFNTTKLNNPDRKYVDGINKPWWKRPKDERDPKTKKIIRSKHQLGEKSFYEVLKIWKLLILKFSVLQSIELPKL